MKVGGIVYVKIFNNRFQIRIPEEKREVEILAQEPFSTKRLLIGEFTIASKYFKKVMKKAYGFRITKPTVVLHPLEKVDGHISEVEKRVFTYLAYSADARKVYICTGSELSDEEVLEKVKNKMF